MNFEGAPFIPRGLHECLREHSGGAWLSCFVACKGVVVFFLCVLFACEGRGAGLVVDGMLVS